MCVRAVLLYKNLVDVVCIIIIIIIIRHRGEGPLSDKFQQARGLNIPAVAWVWKALCQTLGGLFQPGVVNLS